MPLAGGQTQSVETLMLNVDHSITASANQVVMQVDLSVEPGAGAGMMESANDTQADKHVQDPIDGCARKPRNAILD
jgi:hypothetical protein